MTKQSISQSSNNCGQCANAASQIHGDGNSVTISTGQSRYQNSSPIFISRKELKRDLAQIRKYLNTG
jgi:hypothetical protein